MDEELKRNDLEEEKSLVSEDENLDDESSIDNDVDNEIEDEEEKNDDGENNDLTMKGESLNIMDDESINEDAEEDLDISDDEEDYQKFENYNVIENIESAHPEIKKVNFEEVMALTRIVRDHMGNIVDPLHTALPLLTKYEKARIIGARAEQLERGAAPFVKVDENIINGRTIALMEFEEKKIPFIIARPLPNKGIEYWKLSDLECL
jgi:DNA-directed RNA polymerase I, II, and III subunit RPABC2